MTMRGLFYVHLYGAFEFSINRILIAAAQFINADNVFHQNMCNSLGVLVLDGTFRAIKQSSQENQWKKRLTHIHLRSSQDIAQISDGSMDLQNIWYKTLEELYHVFGIANSVMYDVTKRGYVDELVDARNAVAHGRESPIDKGRPKNTYELTVLYEAIRSQTFYVYDCFNEYLKNRAYRV
jgi:RiboL-PSP-HEPN